MKNWILNKSGLWEYHFETQQMIWSEDQKELFGCPTPKSFDDFLELVHPQDRYLFKENDHLSPQQRKEFVFKLNPKIYSGETHILNRFEPFYDTNHQPIGLRGVNTDLTSVLYKRKIFDGLYNLNLVGNLIIDHQGMILYCNAKFTQLTGFSESDIQQKPLIGLINSEYKSIFDQKIKASLANTGSQSFEVKIKKNNGDQLAVILDLISIPDANHIVIAMMDISIVEKEKALFKSFFYLPDTGKAIIQKGFRMIKCNTEYEKITGYTEEELKNLSIEDFILPHSRPITIENYLSRYDHKKQSKESYIIQVYHKKGYVISLKVYAEVIKGTDLLFSSIEDITKELENEKHLLDTISERNSFRDELTESTLVSITDLQGKIVYANEKFREVSKYKLSELIGADHNLLNSYHHPKSFWVNMWKTVSSGHTWRNEVKNRDKDGGFYWVDTTINPVRDANGKIIQYLSVRNIITQKKELEESREKLLSDFEHVAFIASHKIRGPLARMMGLVNLIQQGMVKSDELEMILKGISHTSTEMDDMIREMVSLLSSNALDELVSKRSQEN